MRTLKMNKAIKNDFTFMMFLPVIFLLFSITGYSQTLGSMHSFENESNALFVEEGMELIQALNMLEEQYDVVFLYRSQTVENKLVHQTSNLPFNIEKTLSLLLEKQGLDFKYLNPKTFGIFPDDMKTFDKYEINQDETIRGRIVDAETGEALPGVNILVQGTTTGTSSDANGEFELTVDSLEGVLVFSFIGYETQSIHIEGRNEVNISMEQMLFAGEEMVVVGYGAQREINITGSVDRIRGDALINRTESNLGEMIQGASPNMDIQMGGFGGEPGSTPTWQIRGMGSISGDTQPLILVDGVEMDIDQINPYDIENISVLKDASASAVYGSRGAFGVVIIETKGGEEGISLNYNNNLSIGRPYRLPSQQDALTWATVFNQASANAGRSALYSDEQMERIRGYMEGTFEHEYDPENPIASMWNGRRDGNANYNWPHELLGGTSYSQKHNLSISGGTESTRVRVSLGHVDEPGLYNFGYDYFKRNNVLANVSSQITDWFQADFKANFSQSKSDYPIGITSVERRWMLLNMLNFAPMTPKFNINGTYQHPHIRNLQDAGRIKTEKNDLLVTLSTQVEPVEGWLTNISYNYNLGMTRETQNPRPVDVEVGDGSIWNIGRSSSGYEEEMIQPTYEMFNIRTSYEGSLGPHYYKTMVGYEQEEQFYTSLRGSGTNLITTAVPSISTALGESTVDDSRSHWATQGIFGRFNYNYDETYIIEFSGRYNGSSRFSEGNRWGLFPSGSAGYVISNESFWTPIEPYVNMLKLRGSYGSLGNQNVPNYLHLSSVPVSPTGNWIIGGQSLMFASSPSLISEHLTWETITTLNLGLDAYFLDYRLNLKFDWFERETTDMFGPSESLPGVLGTAAPQENNAAMITKGFEIVIRWDDRLSSDFAYNVQFNIGDNSSTITKYTGNDEGLIDTWYTGKTVGEIWGFKSDGLIQSEGEPMPDQSELYSSWGPGDMKYVDLTGDGKISEGSRTLDDHGDLTVIGNHMPRYNFGLSAGFNWKNFDFNMRWQGIGKRDWDPSNTSMIFWGVARDWRSSVVLQDSHHLDYWRPADETNMLGPNTDAYLPKPYMDRNENYKSRQSQSRYIQNAAYVRLKNLRIGYTLPQEFTSRFAMRQAIIYVSGENLLTFSSVQKSFDPETMFATDNRFGGYNRTEAGTAYPLQRVISLGINITF